MSSGLSFNDAIEVAIGVEFTTNISLTEHQRYLKFNCEVGQFYRFRAYSGYDTTATLFDETGQQRGYNDDGGGDRNPLIEFEAVTPIMYVMIQGYNRPTGSSVPVITAMVIKLDETTVRNVYIYPDYVELIIGQQVQLEVEIEPETAVYDRVSWGVTNLDVVSVSETGLLTALSVGWSEIVAIVLDSNGNSLASTYIYADIYPERQQSSEGDFRSVKLNKLVYGKMEVPSIS